MEDLILESRLSSIVAPAGCGKTQLIINILRRNQPKPYLVLTHTTAGVSALKKRLTREHIPSKNYSVATIDGWLIRIAYSFRGSCHVGSTMENPKLFYPEVRRAVLKYLNSGALNCILKASYSRLLVDEYQDCDVTQHDLIKALATILPTTIFGDPMQCIFDFGRRNAMPEWNMCIGQDFPLLGELSTPWRWENAGTPRLGRWILDVREELMRGGQVDLLSCPEYVTWHRLTGLQQVDLAMQRNVQHSILNKYPNDSLLVIGSSVNELSRHQYAQGTSRIEVVEQVQLCGVMLAATMFDQQVGFQLIKSLLDVAASMITNIEVTHTLRRVTSILAKRNKTAPFPHEQALCTLAIEGTRRNLLTVLELLPLKSGTRIYRKTAYEALKDAVSHSISQPSQTIAEAASVIRERIRHNGDKRIPSRAIGSTLLLKGLETDHCIILDAQGKGMNAKNLYVALSRGAKSITVFSADRYIGYP
jgi:DNA helicase-2/ATP-dependent DNA helicase PcrA